MLAKRWLHTVTAMALSCDLHAQETQHTAGHRPQKQGESQIKIVCLGDSITGQPNLASYMKWSFILEAMCDAAKGPGLVQVVNRGIGGDTSAGAVKRLQGDVLDEKPEVAIVLLGGNDAGQKRAPADVKADLETIVRKVKGAGAKVLLLQYAVLPNPAGPETAWVHLDDNNALIAEIAAAEQVPVLDMASAMEEAFKNQLVTELKGRDGNGIATWETRPLSQSHLVSATDGVHLSPGGELVFARAIFQKLSQLGWLRLQK
jgi:lysophospholipase L1-like esterase